MVAMVRGVSDVMQTARLDKAVSRLTQTDGGLQC